MNLRKKKIIWISGLAGAGKTTLGDQLSSKLWKLDVPNLRVDGDDIRSKFAKIWHVSERFDRKSRAKLNQAYAQLGKLALEQGFVGIVTTISMPSEEAMAQLYGEGNYLRIYLIATRCNLEKRRQSLYQVKNQSDSRGAVVGCDICYIEPENLDWIFCMDKPLDLDESILKILDNLVPTRGAV